MWTCSTDVWRNTQFFVFWALRLLFSCDVWMFQFVMPAERCVSAHIQPDAKRLPSIVLLCSSNLIHVAAWWVDAGTQTRLLFLFPVNDGAASMRRRCSRSPPCQFSFIFFTLVCHTLFFSPIHFFCVCVCGGGGGVTTLQPSRMDSYVM